MTTTLRPIGAEERTPGGGRARSYDICVNSRPVGVIQLATDEAFGPRAGRIVRLGVAQGDRRRGRGTVAALAAEEVLRSWGCRSVEASVPADAATALHLAAALGYAERNRNMAKTLPAAPPRLPEGSEGRPMTAREFGPWWEHAQAEYEREWRERGLDAEQARAKADADGSEGLPDGLATPGALLSVLTHHGTAVGTLWVALRPQEEPGAYVYDVEVPQEHRGRGHGRSLMLLAEAQALQHGLRRLGLNVFAGNTTALRLYISLGYEPTEYHLSKPLL